MNQGQAPAKGQNDPPSGGEKNKSAALLEGEDLEVLRTRARERDEFLNLLQRTRAEFENYQKRSQKDREQERKYMYGSILFDLLPVLDNLERAITAAQKAGEKGPLAEGMGLVLSQFLDFLKRYGVSRIDAQDKPFDPNLHQALMQQEAPNLPANTIIQVIEPGYLNQDRVLRPAKVIVSTANQAKG